MGHGHTFRCGGSWIGIGNAILTAAHCSDGVIASLVSVRVGSTEHASGGDVRFKMTRDNKGSVEDIGPLGYPARHNSAGNHQESHIYKNIFKVPFCQLMVKCLQLSLLSLCDFLQLLKFLGL